MRHRRLGVEPAEESLRAALEVIARYHNLPRLAQFAVDRMGYDSTEFIGLAYRSQEGSSTNGPAPDSPEAVVSICYWWPEKTFTITEHEYLRLLHQVLLLEGYDHSANTVATLLEASRQS
jgi:hypothetical protein